MFRLFGFGLLLASTAFAKPVAHFDGFVEVEPGVTLYARVLPGNELSPLVLSLNGLTQDVDHWDSLESVFRQKQIGRIYVDLALQGRSLVKRLDNYLSFERPIVDPILFHGGPWGNEPTLPVVEVATQARYVSTLLKKLEISKKVILNGLSYGGGLALQMAVDFPEQIQAAVLAAPFVFPMPSQDQMIRSTVATMRLNPVWAVVPYDDVYDIVLRNLVLTTYPSVEPEILKWRPPYQAMAVAELVRGIRHLKYEELLKRLKLPVHLITAGKDKYIPRDKLAEFWSEVPASVRGHWLEIDGVEHKINETAGAFMAAWISEISSKSDRMKTPGHFFGEPGKGLATEIGGTRVVQLGPFD